MTLRAEAENEGGHRATSGTRAISVVAFALVLLPCIVRLTTHDDTFFGALLLGPWGIMVQAGLFLGGLVMTAMGSLPSPSRSLPPWVVTIGVLACTLGSVPIVLTTSTGVAAPLLWTGGLLFGTGLTIVGLAWSVIADTTDLRRLLTHCAIVGLVAVIALNLLSLLPAALTGAIYFALVLTACIPPLSITHRNRLVFPRYNAGIDLGIEDDLFVERTSLGDLAFVLATSTIGLMLFAALSNARLFEVTPSGPSSTSYGLIGSALIILFTVRISRAEAIVPLAYWILFPAISGVLIVLDAFPVGSWPFEIGAAGASFFFSAVGMFAVALLLAVNHRGKFSPLVTVGATLALLAAAASVGRLLTAFGVDYTLRGPILLIASTCYFVYLLIAPAAQLWRARRQELHNGSDRLTVNDHTCAVCEKLAARFELTHRETEVLHYAGRGYSSSYIARALFVSDSTVRSHLKNIYRKMGVTSKMEVIELFQNARARAPEAED